MSDLWRRPANLTDRDLFNGPWGVECAPDPRASYAFVALKHHGVNPGMAVRDPAGRTWRVKQAANDGRAAEGPVEVVLSRVLSAVGYHQPPVYYLPSFTLADEHGRHTEAGGRFRLDEPTLKEVGSWSWQQNPFVGTKPYQGLLVVLLMFNSSDLKNANNSLYEHRTGDFVERWYVVRDLGTALGETGRMAPRRADPEAFERSRFVLSVRDGFVDFDYHGFHQELVRNRITADEVGWASYLLAQLTDTQWTDAFRAGGFTGDTADRFIRAIKSNIAKGREVGGNDWP